MKTIAKIEELRQERQVQLDALKTAEERNRWGQFATPIQLAQEIIRLALQNRGTQSEDIDFLDPAFGTGSFLSALLASLGDMTHVHATGIELDPLFAQAARDLWDAPQVHVVEGDFTKLSPSLLDQKPNLIVCNPPYIRHHHMTRDQKVRLKNQVYTTTGLTISGLAGMYCYFMLLAHLWLREGGLGVWLVPTEFMDVKYGSALRDYLTRHVTLKQIHRFGSLDVQFTDALVSSAIVVFQKIPPQTETQILLTVGGLPTAPHQTYQVDREWLRQQPKWTHEPDHTRPLHRQGEITFGSLFKASRGIATGANSFFIMTRDEAEKRVLPLQFLRPILPSPRHIKVSVIEADSDGFPLDILQLVLLDCDLPEDAVREQFPSLWAYLEYGKSMGIHQRYLTSRRAPWYRQEERAYTPFLCTYMGRSDHGEQPFTFIWNKSSATAPNVYLLLYPRKQWASAVMGDHDVQAEVFDLLGHIHVDELIHEGRTYGGGLHKIEPHEFYNIHLANAGALDRFITEPREFQPRLF
jgi:predicted RNA methylase